MKLNRILYLLALIGTLLLLPSYSTALAKSLPHISSGQSCRKEGVVAGTSATSFVCTKVKKRLVWRKLIISQTTTTSTLSTTTSTLSGAPAAPSGLTFSIKTPFDDTGTISWVDNSNNEEFFYVSNIDPATLGATPLSSLFAKKPSNSTSLGVWKFVNGVTYCYWVMASNSFGNSAWAGPVCSNPALTSTTTTAYVPPTTAYVPPTTAYVPPTTATVPSFGGGGRSSANWLGCYFKGQKMWGSVYITTSPWAADFVVYQSSSSWGSDLRVYTTSSSWAASSCGIWYITSSSWAADFTIYLTSSSWSADFSIYSTSSSWTAGR